MFLVYAKGCEKYQKGFLKKKRVAAKATLLAYPTACDKAIVSSYRFSINSSTALCV